MKLNRLLFYETLMINSLALQWSLNIFQFTTDRMIEIQVIPILKVVKMSVEILMINPQYQKNQMTKCW